MPTLALLHGYPFDGSLWDAVRKLLADDGVEAWCPDLPGFGNAAPLTGRTPTIDDFARGVLDRATREGLPDFAVAGHSFGGYVALALAALAPARLTGLGLVSSRTGADSDEARKNRLASVNRVRSEGTSFLGPSLLAKLASPLHRGRVVPMLEPYFARARPDGVASALHAMAHRPDRLALVRAWKRPLLVLHGDDDELVPISEAEHLAKAAPHARLVRVHAVGHVPMLEAPLQTAEALSAFAQSSTS